MYTYKCYSKQYKMTKQSFSPYLVSPFWPLLTVPEGTVIFTGVTELDKGRTLFAAFGLCLGAIDVSVGPTESVILIKKIQSENRLHKKAALQTYK